jgi:alkylated DNA nucleotide flippase Atl1
MIFALKVCAVVKSIPSGIVMTYKEVTILAENQHAHRAVGNILHKNPDIQKIPCH